MTAHKTTCSTPTRITFINDEDPNKATLWCIFRKKKTDTINGYNVTAHNKERHGLEFWMNAMLDDDGNALQKPAKPTEKDALFYMQKAEEFLS